MNPALHAVVDAMPPRQAATLSALDGPDHQIARALQALARYERRQLPRKDPRKEHPEGTFDNAKRFYPTGVDKAALAPDIREPSRNWPNSFNHACRSLAHCERLEGADHQVVLAVRRAGLSAALKGLTEKQVGAESGSFAAYLHARSRLRPAPTGLAAAAAAASAAPLIETRGMDR